MPLFWKPWKGKTSPNQAPEAVTLQETLEQAQSPQELHGCLRRDVQTPSAKVPIPGHIQVGAEVTAYWRHRQRLMALSGVNYRRAIFVALRLHAKMQTAHRELKRAIRARKRERLLETLRLAEDAASRGDSSM